MNLKEAFIAINTIAQNTYNDDAYLILDINGLSIIHKGSVVWSKVTEMAVEEPFDLEKPLTINALKPIARRVLEDFEYYCDYEYHSDLEDEENVVLYASSMAWAEKELGELLK